MLTPTRNARYIPPIAETKATGIGVPDRTAHSSRAEMHRGFFVPRQAQWAGRAEGRKARQSVLWYANPPGSAHPTIGVVAGGKYATALEQEPAMQPDLPKVIEFSHLHDVKLEHVDGYTRVIARIKPCKHDRGYKSATDLPFVYRDPTNKYHWFYVRQPAENYREQQERGDYFWNEFVRYVRGNQKRRRTDAIRHTSIIVKALFAYESCINESSRFTEHLAEALVAHLRVGLDEGKTDKQLADEAKEDASEVAA